MYEGLVDATFHSAGGLWTLKRCCECKCGYLDPRPTREYIGYAYRDYYTHVSSSRQADTELDAPRRLVRSIANSYRNSRYGTQLQPAISIGANLIKVFPLLRAALDREMRYLPSAPPDARLLDIGCGSGAFLRRALLAGWTVTGIDPDPDAIEQARTICPDVRVGQVSDLTYSTEWFDAITMSHVIEHVHDPKSMLCAAFQLLKPGGMLYLETPNIDALSHKRFKQCWRGLEPPRHLVLFNWDALETLLLSVGFGQITRLVWKDTYPRLASSSRAIRKGEPFCDGRRPTVGDYIGGCLAGLRVIADHRLSDLIGIIVRRPTLTVAT